MAPRSYYQIAINHPGLNKHRVIRGNDRYLIEAAAATQQRAWAEQYARKVEADERRREREKKVMDMAEALREAEERTADAQSILMRLRAVLAASLCMDARVDWAGMLQPPFSQPQPTVRPFIPLPPEPTFDPDAWRQQKGLVTALVPFLARQAEAAARAEFDAVHAKWRERMDAVCATNENIYAENLRDFEDWQRRAAAHEVARTEHNGAVEQARAAYGSLDADAVLDYCELILSRSKYPDLFPKEFDLDYRAAARTLVVEYQLPAPDDLPRLKSVKFSRTKRDFLETELSKREFAQLYSDVVFQVALRTAHELFEADVVRALEEVIFNGKVHVLNVGTGYEEDRCILSVRAGRAAFEAINLRNIEPRACFESLGGIATAKMVDCREVKPLAAIDKTEGRFTAAQDVSGADASGLDEWLELAKTISDPQDIRFLPVTTIASLIGLPVAEELSLELSHRLSDEVATRGYAVEPDARHAAAPYRATDEVALFRPLEATVTRIYPAASALLKLYFTVAAADEHITEDELRTARDFFVRNIPLTPGERQRLSALESHLCRHPGAAERFLAGVTIQLPRADRQMVAEVLICIAGSNGVITSAELQAMGRACTLLDLPPGTLDEILDKFFAKFDEPTVQEADPATPGELLPEMAPPPAAPSFKLDMSRVAAISHETAQVIALLAAVMSEDEPTLALKPSPAPLPPVVVLETPAWLGHLDVKYHAITARIVAKAAWTRAEFQQLAAEFNLMPLGVSDALNEWADEHLGEFLLDGEDPVTVNATILPKQP